MTRKEIYFTAFGDPAPQGSKNVYNGRLVEASKKLKPWRAAVADAVFRTFVATGDDTPFTEPVIVYATFYLPRPKSVKRLLPSVPPDTDKLCRSLGDAMSIDSHLLADDSLIVRWVATKLYADSHNAGVRVGVRLATVEELERAEVLTVIEDEDFCVHCGK